MRTLFISSILVKGFIFLSFLGFSLSLHAEEVTLKNGLDGYEGTSDTTLYGSPDARKTLNFGNQETLGAQGVRGGGIKQLGLIRFGDIEKRLPSGSETVVTHAVLRLYKVNQPKDDGQYERIKPSQRAIRAYLMLTDWKAGSGAGKNGDMIEESATYAYREYHPEKPVYWGDSHKLEEGPVPDVDFDSQRLKDSPLTMEPDEWMEWDVTDMVQEWVADPSSNHGFFLTALSYWVGAVFASSNSPDESLCPELVISY